MHGCSGLQPDVVTALTTHAQQLVDNGFVALALNSFGPRGIGGGQVRQTFANLSEARSYRVEYALQAKTYLANLPFVDSDNVLQIDQSNSGSVALKLSQLHAPAFRVQASCHPWCGAFNRVGTTVELTSPLMIFGGVDDDWVPPTACAKATANGADYKVVIYPDTAHSFDLSIEMQCYQGHLVGYTTAATTDSQALMVAFSNGHITGATEAKPTLQAAGNTVFLSATEISKLMSTGAVNGVNEFGNPYTISFDADGSMSGSAGRDDKFRDTGKWWGEEDMLYRQYIIWLDAAKACFRVSLTSDQINWHDVAGHFSALIHLRVRAFFVSADCQRFASPL